MEWKKRRDNNIPTVKKLIININSTKTGISFLCALYTFGKYQGHHSIKCTNIFLKEAGAIVSQ